MFIFSLFIIFWGSLWAGRLQICFAWKNIKHPRSAFRAPLKELGSVEFHQSRLSNAIGIDFTKVTISGPSTTDYGWCQKTPWEQILRSSGGILFHLDLIVSALRCVSRKYVSNGWFVFLDHKVYPLVFSKAIRPQVIFHGRFEYSGGLGVVVVVGGSVWENGCKNVRPRYAAPQRQAPSEAKKRKKTKIHILKELQSSMDLSLDVRRTTGKSHLFFFFFFWSFM